MEQIINKKGFKVGEKVKVIREAKHEDYKEVYPGVFMDTARYIYKVKKEYKIQRLYTTAVALSNCAVIPNHLIKRV